MTEHDEFEERLSELMFRIADSRAPRLDHRAIVEAAVAVPGQRRTGWAGFAAAVGVAAIAGVVGISIASLLPSAPTASSAPSSSPFGASEWSHVAWERAPADPGLGHDAQLNQWMGGIVTGGPGFVAWGLDEKRLPDRIGNGYAVWVSEDGLSWREVIFDPDAQTNGAGILEMAAGPAGIVASGATCCNEPEPGFFESIPARWFSPDGEHWSRVLSDGLQPDPEFHATTLVAGPGGFVEAGAANDQPAVWFSPDGTNWTGTSLGVSGFSSGIINDVSADANGYVAVGEVWNDEQGLAVVWRSSSGADWVRVGVTDPVLSMGPINSLERVIKNDAGIFLMGRQALPEEEQTCFPFPIHPGGPEVTECVTSEPVQLFSPDADHWTILPIPETREGDPILNVIKADGTGLIAVGPANDPGDPFPAPSLWTSVDGVHWTRAVEEPPLASGDFVHGFVVAGDRIIAVGQRNDANSAAVWIATRLHEPSSRTPNESAPPESSYSFGGCGLIVIGRGAARGGSDERVEFSQTWIPLVSEPCLARRLTGLIQGAGPHRWPDVRGF